jgi:hypothetical protein
MRGQPASNPGVFEPFQFFSVGSQVHSQLKAGSPEDNHGRLGIQWVLDLRS